MLKQQRDVHRASDFWRQLVEHAVGRRLPSHKTPQALCHKPPSLQAVQQDGSHLEAEIAVPDGSAQQVAGPQPIMS